ncbi:MAG: fused MFS/spermidine synthase, partial [Candidatus Diapherotrites archaeon]|nr:fused MFS/spermidine synthase [Candidatus Diapherotrites archaeon]
MNPGKAVLLLNVFLAGFVVMALEIVGIRILASFFGYSIFVWGTIIGIILVSLSIGYFFGGMLADRAGKFETIYKIILAATFYLAIAIIIYPLFLEAISKWNLFAGISLASVILLVPPSILLSMVSPIATKMLLKKGKEGTTIGNIYALSNFGSILGVFLPTFYFLPFFGSKATMIGCFAGLVITALIGLNLEKARKKILLAMLVIAVLLFSAIFVFAETPSKYLLVSTESAYNLIEVKQFDGTRWLILNGSPMSYHEENETLELYFYDAMAVFPHIIEKEDVLILGFASGTVAGKIESFYPEVAIEGVELDGKVVELAYSHFGLGELENTKVFVDDARHFLQVNDKRYGIIFNNTINARFIPFHTVSKEFFELADSRLEEDGVLVNYSFYTTQNTCEDSWEAGLMCGTIESASYEKTMVRDSIARTMCEVFEDVYYLNFPNQNVSLL